MAIKKTVEIVTKVGDAAKDIKKLFDDLLKKELEAKEGVEDLNKEFKDLGKDTTSTLKKIEKGVENTEKSTGVLAKGFKGIGLAIKAAGIGLVISLFGTLKEVFQQNQKVANALSTTFETVSIVFNELTSVVVDVFEKVSKATNGMEGLKNVISGLITIALTPLKLTFYNVSIAISELQLAWEESFLGDGDPETIAKLAKRITDQKDALVEVGNSAIEAGSKVVNNIGKAITEVGAIVEGTVEGVSKISITSAYETAKANVQLENTAKLAEAQQARLVEIYDRQAEKLRQLRDDDLKSIPERQKANEDLAKVLEEQEKAMLAQAAAQIASAQANFSKNKSIENQVELTNALANREGVLAQIEGLRSEQLSNRIALEKEAFDLAKSRSESEAQLLIEQKLFEAERLKDTEAKLEAEKQALEFQKQLDLERLEANIEFYAADTQAKLDAEIAYNERKQEIENELLLKQDEIDQYKLDKEKEAAEGRNNILKAEAEFKEQQYQNTYSNLQTILSAGGKKLNKIGKALAIADVLRTSAKSVSETVSNIGIANAAATAASPLTAGMPFVAINTLKGALQIGATIAGATKAIQSIRSEGQSVPSSGGIASSGAGASGSVPTQSPSPQFNIVGNSGANQIAESLGREQPIRTYVVSTDVTSAQSLDRNIIGNASIG